MEVTYLQVEEIDSIESIREKNSREIGLKNRREEEVGRERDREWSFVKKKKLAMRLLLQIVANLDDHKMATTGQHDGNISYHNQQYTIAKLTNQRQQNNCLSLRMFDNVLIVQHEAAQLKLKEA